MRRESRFEIVDVDAIAVGFFANGMAGAMGELVAEPGARDYAARDIVHFSAANRFTGANVFADKIDGRIARFPHNVENAGVLFRNGFAHVASPGLVGCHCVSLVKFGSGID